MMKKGIFVGVVMAIVVFIYYLSISDSAVDVLNSTFCNQDSDCIMVPGRYDDCCWNCRYEAVNVEYSLYLRLVDCECELVEMCESVPIEYYKAVCNENVCEGVYVGEDCGYDNPNKRYVSNSSEICAVVKVACEEDEKAFSNKCGCGCEKVISDGDDSFWKTDDIVLMQSEVDGTFGCFGCTEDGGLSEQGVCVDPSEEMKRVEETADMYCSSEFEIIRSGE